MDDMPSLRFDGCLATNIEQAYRHLEQVYEQLVGVLGLSVLEWYALRALYREDGLSASRLACEVCRHPSSMTALLDRMEEKHLLRREIDADDRRGIRVYLTDQGRAHQPRVEAIAAQIDALLNDLVTPDQLATFQYVLSVLQNVKVPESEES
jgi:DNA-binding MarR family transcriptional regulator